MKKVRKGLALLLTLLMLAVPLCTAGADTVKFTVTGSANTGGTVTKTVECEKGEDATVEIKAHAGYRLVGVMVNGVSVDPVEVRNDLYVLSDVQKNMAVRALFVKSQATDFAARFVDMKKGIWYYNAVNLLTGLGIVDGVSSTQYKPGSNVTRAQFVKLLYTLAETLGVSVKESTDYPFTDVPKENNWAAGYIGWGYQAGVLKGVDTAQTRFAPNNPITRQDMAVTLQRFFVDYLKYELPGDTKTIFTDAVNISPYAKEAVEYVVRVGLMGGNDDGTFKPRGNTLRSHVAQVFYNYLFPFDKEGPVATTQNGKVSGTYSKDGKIAVYKGIPYAAPPVGELRWKAPEPAKNWEGVLACDEWGASAIQPEQKPFMMWSTEFIIEDTGYSEDCLTLNVWAKDDTVKNKPVIVYIHGGGFTSGGSSCEVYDGEYMARKDVVFVNINYRVGILGFLAHPELNHESPEGVSGNYGILDQIAALQWVKKNIANFGGNPNNVTIMGQSAGAASVNALVASPKAAGLFQTAFAMSFDSVSSDWDNLGTKSNEGKTAFGSKSLKDMRAMTTAELLEMQSKNAYTSAPCVDGKVLKNTFRGALENGSANDVTLITGMVEGDTMLFVGWTAGTVAEYEQHIKDMCGNDQALIDKALKAYPADAATLGAMTELFKRDTLMAAENYVKLARDKGGAAKDTYVYLFSHVMPGPDAQQYGAFHTSDVPYFFNVFSAEREKYWAKVDYEVGERLSGYLLNIAKTGNPNGTNLPKWDASKGDYSYTTLNSTGAAVTTMTADQADFWQAYFAAKFAVAP